jgi:putative nucleotidyltransferase with HDIG domain
MSVRRLGLVGDFAVRSLAMTLVFAGVLAGVSAWLVRAALVDASNLAVRTPIEAMLAETVPDAAFLGGPLAGPVLTSVDDATRKQFLGADLVALKVFDAGGLVVYSTMSDEVGRRYPVQPEQLAAMSGRVTTGVEGDAADGDSAAVVRRFGPVVESYAPVVSRVTGKPVAVCEVYQRYAPIGAAVRRTVAVIWSVIGLVSILVYAGQLGIVRSAEQRLKVSEAEAVLSSRRLEESLLELESHTVGTLQALVTAVDAKDSYTASHSLGVADTARCIGGRLGLDEDQLVRLEKAALLHDIGKIGIAERILLKPTVLTPDEQVQVHEHAELGARMVASVPFLSDVVPAIRHHHERWDGTGYPDHLAGEDIPLLARILSVADAYDAMSSDRPYREGLSWYRTRQQLRRNSGGQFDPQVVTALLAALRAGEVTVQGRHPEPRGLGAS